MFRKLYDRVLIWSRSPHAPWYLGGVSIAEAIFFPLPTDIMLAPMVMSQRDRAWFLATLTTLSSVTGGVLGYLLGYFAFTTIEPWLLDNYSSAYTIVQQWFDDYGIWVVFIGGFTPVPYKVFTISAGGAQMALLPFILASLVGRGARYFLVAALVKWGGPAFEKHLLRYIDLLGWASIVIILLAWLGYRQFG